MGIVFREYFKEKFIWIYFLLDLIALGFLTTAPSPLKLLPYTLILLTVPLVELFIHKYVLHCSIEGKPQWFVNYMERLHVGHHRDPSYIPLIFAPFTSGIALPIFFGGLFGIITGDMYVAVTCFFLAMSYYLFYEWMHLAHHLEKYRPKTEMGRKLKRLHLWHHYKNENYWWGITTLIGDKLAGSAPNPKSVATSDSVKNLHGTLPEALKER